MGRGCAAGESILLVTKQKRENNNLTGDWDGRSQDETIPKSRSPKTVEGDWVSERRGTGRGGCI